MATVITQSDTLLFNPTSSTGASNMSASNSYPLTNSYDSISSTSYTRFTVTNTGYIYYLFNISGIPEGATITNVNCIVRTYINARITNASTQLYYNTTAKGSAQSITNTSASNITISNTGDWQTSELSNLRLRIGGTKSNNSQNGYIYVYGINLSITYEYNYNQYEITSVLSTNDVDAIDPEGVTNVKENESYTLEIHAASIQNIKVEDNGVDVTDTLVQHAENTDDTISQIPSSNFDTGFSSTNAEFYKSQYETGSSRLEYAIGYSAESPNPVSDTGYTYVKDNNNNTATGWIIYNFDFSNIPSNATIQSITVKVYGARESSTTDSTHMAKLGVYSGTTLKGSEQEFTSTNNSIVTLNNVGTWTREELQQAKLRFTVAYYGGRIFGATWTVEYTVPTTNPYYWTYTLNNVSADHQIIIGDKIIEIPDEDPQYNYYPITISSINASTTPRRGTTRIVEGSNQTIEIYPDDPLITLITDNGVDVSDQLVAHGGIISDPTVTTVGNYGFNLNSSSGYYVSSNQGISRTAALSRIDFDFPVRCLVTIQFINYAEATYDFGVFGNLDSPLSSDYYAAGSNGATITDTDYKLACNTSQYNTSAVQTITYEVPAGQHYLHIKYSKDDATDSNNDTLQWKITNIEALEANNYYTYTLTNIQEAHSLIFIFGDVTYYINNASGSNCKLYPSGQYVVLPGETYQLTIVPDDYSYDVLVVDNGNNVQPQRVEQQITKEGTTYTVVNYVYELTNVQLNHNISVTCTPTSLLYYKQDERWNRITKLYIKDTNEWSEQSNPFIIMSINKLIFNG